MKNNYKHGLSYLKEYAIFRTIMARCYSPNDHNYKYYGARGIRVFPAWIGNQKLFIDYIKSLPNYNIPKYSLDRINNNGNYEPGNLRWVSKSTQVLNRNRYIRLNNLQISGNDLIHWDKSKNKWRVRVTIDGKRKHLGHFNIIDAAIIARNDFISKNSSKYIMGADPYIS